MTDRILGAFYAQLKSYFGNRNLQVCQWERSRTPNIIKIASTPRTTLLYVKVSTLKEPWWGLDKTQMGLLRDSQAKWFIVLLEGSIDKGIVLSPKDVQENQDKWYIGGKEHAFKVHKQYLDPKFRFYSFDGLMLRITNTS